jgi:hypothetical protein
MTTKFFSIFTGIAMVITIVCVTVAKNLSQGFAAFGKKPILIALLTSVLDALLAFAITYSTDEPFILFWILCVIFLVFGCIHVGVMHNKFIHRDGEKTYMVMGAEVLFAFAVMFFTVVLFCLLQYFLKDKTFLFYPELFSVLMFLVPLFFYYTFRAAYHIPEPVFKTWQYPAISIDPPDENANEHLLVIGFDIPKKLMDKKTFFRAKTPEAIVLGELFYHFMNDYNELQSETPIQYLDAKKEPVIWWFRLKRKWYQINKVLDPSITVRENGIKENSVIICEQLIN